jgi:hypothetical protein
MTARGKKISFVSEKLELLEHLHYKFIGIGGEGVFI